MSTNVNPNPTPATTSFAKVLSTSPKEGLLRLRSAIDNDNLLRQSYADPSGQKGCLLYHLFGVRSRTELLKCEVDTDAAHHVIQAWDRNELSVETVSCMLNKAIAEREEVNALEETMLRKILQSVQEEVTV